MSRYCMIDDWLIPWTSDSTGWHCIGGDCSDEMVKRLRAKRERINGAD